MPISPSFLNRLAGGTYRYMNIKGSLSGLRSPQPKKSLFASALVCTNTRKSVNKPAMLSHFFFP